MRPKTTRRRAIYSTWSWAALIAGALISAPASLAECNTAPIATDDFVSVFGESILDPLANDTDSQGQLLELQIDSQTCPGVATVDFGLLTYDPQTPNFDDCTIAYSVTDSEGASASATIHVALEPGIFADDYESGDASRWSGWE